MVNFKHFYPKIVNSVTFVIYFAMKIGSMKMENGIKQGKKIMIIWDLMLQKKGFILIFCSLFIFFPVYDYPNNHDQPNKEHAEHKHLGKPEIHVMKHHFLSHHHSHGCWGKPDHFYNKYQC